jgi:CBS domain-containing protein
MQVKNIMTQSPACCTPDTKLQNVAKQMIDNHCGCVPVIEKKTQRLIGVITDRDIVCRALATGKEVRELVAGDCMSSDVVTAMPDMDVGECGELMKASQIRRIPVVDVAGHCCGIVSQADLAEACAPQRVTEIVRGISRHTDVARTVFG